MPTDFMIDIETAGTTARAPVIDIGCVAIRDGALVASHRYQINIIEYDTRYRGQFDVDLQCMVDFWSNQPVTTRNNVFGGLNVGRSWSQHSTISVALHNLSLFLDSQTNKKHIWAKPPQFDLVILRHAYQVVGLTPAWHFREERCFRTLLDENKHLVPDLENFPSVGMEHNALDDALYQAKLFLAIRNAQTKS